MSLNELFRQMTVEAPNSRDELDAYISTLDLDTLSLEELERWYALSYRNDVLEAIKAKCPLTYFELLLNY